jgi:hypothetical protein
LEIIRIKNNETYVTFPLFDSVTYEPYTVSAWSYLSNATIDCYSWSDSTSANQIIITGNPIMVSSTGLWQMYLSQTDMNPNEGNDNYLIIKFDADEIESQTLLVKLVDNDVYITSDNIKLKTDLLPDDPASNSVVYSRLATSAYSDVSSDISDIKLKTDLLSFSGSNLNVRVLDSGILNDISVSDILNGVVDTKTVEEILEILLAYANGRILVSGNSYTYYKQDNSESLFTLTGSDTTRIRT